MLTTAGGKLPAEVARLQKEKPQTPAPAGQASRLGPSSPETKIAPFVRQDATGGAAPRRTGAGASNQSSGAGTDNCAGGGSPGVVTSGHRIAAPGPGIDALAALEISLGALAGPTAARPQHIDMGPLPVYSLLVDPDTRTKLEISAEQQTELWKIVSAYRAKLGEQLSKQSPGERNARGASEINRWEAQQKKGLASQVEKVLSSRQIDRYKAIAFPDKAYAAISDPNTLKAVAATPAQCDRLRQIQLEHRQRFREKIGECIDRLLAVLSAEQTKKLRAAIERGEHELAEPSGYSGAPACTPFYFANHACDGPVGSAGPLDLPAPYHRMDWVARQRLAITACAGKTPAGDRGRLREEDQQPLRHDATRRALAKGERGGPAGGAQGNRHGADAPASRGDQRNRLPQRGSLRRGVSPGPENRRHHRRPDRPDGTNCN